MSNSENASGASSLDTPVDWERFPELVRATTFGNDIDSYLTDIGVDPLVLSTDEPIQDV